jgi:thymidylate synthase ThyX
MISVKLKTKTEMNVHDLSSFAARVCYTADLPSDDKTIDVKARLFEPGHHTTIEHNHFTFTLDGVSVSSIVFGMHLNAPYYNSDQRSGRFSKMYQSPDVAEIRKYLNHFYPNEDTDLAVSFVEKGMKIYQENIGPLTALAAKVIKEDRPNANDKYIEQNAPKFAQEQLRMFISQVMPTALAMTINTSALVALWQVAWSPEMREITNQMRDEVLRVHPEIAYMFDESKRQNRDWTPKMNFTDPHIHKMPTCILQKVDIPELANLEMKNAVDILPFSPFAMKQNTSTVKTEVEMSCATMGQDQRHRSIRRGEPVISGNFYLPPLLEMGGLEKTALEYVREYAALAQKLSPALMTTIAPYGAMVMYQKEANLNALMHEQGKRLCWCAQEEISELARQLRQQMLSVCPAVAEKLAPPCYKGGCREGVRFCGRQTNKALVSDYFERRRV